MLRPVNLYPVVLHPARKLRPVIPSPGVPGARLSRAITRALREVACAGLGARRIKV
jgi:hypothetical protein